MIERERRDFLRYLLLSLAGLLILPLIGYKKGYGWRSKELKEADFYKKDDLAG